jgi:hypothetical protein
LVVGRSVIYGRTAGSDSVRWADDDDDVAEKFIAWI